MGDQTNRGARRVPLTGCIATIACLAVAATATVATAATATDGGAGNARYGQQGRWITDQAGRVAILHGFNMVNKVPATGYAPDGTGFGNDDATFLAANGFDVMRIGVIWKALEPRPGVYDDAYLNRIYKTYVTLRRHGVATMLDFHQDLFNTRFQGDGAPDWAVVGPAATMEPTPQAGFPFNYVVQDAVNQAFDAFWANTEVPGTGRGVQDFYADAWAHVAKRFAGKPGIVGYNLMNEPWPGTMLQNGLAKACAVTPTSCGIQQFEATDLTSFYRRVVKAIRTVDTRSTVWAAPTLAADFGASSGVGTLAGPAGFAFNAYCGQLQAGIAGVIPYAKGKPCSYTAKLSFENAEAISKRNDQALFMTEFGNADTLANFEDYLTAADRYRVSWTEWAYTGYDGTAADTGTESLVIDPRRAPTGANVKAAKLRWLARPYPKLTSGIPGPYAFTPSSKTFTLTYTPKRAGGGAAFTAGSITTISTPRVQYPKGYGVRISGARVTSAANAPTLRLALCSGAAKVSVTVKPGQTAASARRCS